MATASRRARVPSSGQAPGCCAWRPSTRHSWCDGPGSRVPILVLFPIPADAVREAAESRLELVVTDADGAGELLAAWAVGCARRNHAARPSRDRDGAPARWRARDAAAGTAHPSPIRRAWNWPGSGRTSRAPRTRPSPPTRRPASGAPCRDRGRRPARPPRAPLRDGGLFAGTGAPHDLVRPGLALYGELPDDLPLSSAAAAAAAALRPVMRLVARPLRVAQVDPGTPVGYGGRWTATRPSLIATMPGRVWRRLRPDHAAGRRGAGTRPACPGRGQRRHGCARRST